MAVENPQPFFLSAWSVLGQTVRMSVALSLLKLVDVARIYQTIEGAVPVAILKGISLELAPWRIGGHRRSVRFR